MFCFKFEGKILKYNFDDLIDLWDKKNKTRQDNMAISMFVLFMNSLFVEGHLDRTVMIPEEMMKYEKFLDRYKEIRENVKLVKFLPRFEEYFIDVVSMRSKVLHRKLGEYAKIKILRNPKTRFRRSFKDDDMEKWIHIEECESNSRWIRMFQSVISNRKNLNLYNPNYLLLQMILVCFHRPDRSTAKHYRDTVDYVYKKNLPDFDFKKHLKCTIRGGDRIVRSILEHASEFVRSNPIKSKPKRKSKRKKKRAKKRKRDNKDMQKFVNDNTKSKKYVTGKSRRLK